MEYCHDVTIPFPGSHVELATPSHAYHPEKVELMDERSDRQIP